MRWHKNMKRIALLGVLIVVIAGGLFVADTALGDRPEPSEHTVQTTNASGRMAFWMSYTDASNGGAIYAGTFAELMARAHDTYPMFASEDDRDALQADLDVAEARADTLEANLAVLRSDLAALQGAVATSAAHDHLHDHPHNHGTHEHDPA